MDPTAPTATYFYPGQTIGYSEVAAPLSIASEDALPLDEGCSGNETRATTTSVRLRNAAERTWSIWL